MFYDSRPDYPPEFLEDMVPVYVADLEDQVKELRARVAELEARLAKAETFGHRIAELDAQLADVQPHNTELIIRANAAEAKLARVKEALSDYEHDLSSREEAMDKAWDILADTPKEDDNG